MEVAFAKSNRVTEAAPYKLYPHPNQGIRPICVNTWGYEAKLQNPTRLLFPSGRHVF